MGLGLRCTSGVPIFANGAQTAAMAHLLNAELSNKPGDPHGEPFVEDEDLNYAARDVLVGNRTLDADGRLIFSLPKEWQAVPLSRGAVIAPPSWVPPVEGTLRSVVRVQPPGSASHNPNGYYVVYNSNGQPISPYSGRTVSRKKWHNEFTVVVPAM